MLAPDSRALLMEQLAPPPGTSLNAAVATTFTLDLTATLLPALAFTGFEVAAGVGDPIATLESLRSTAGKIDVFCQGGAISVPDKSPDLLAFLEPIIHPVRAPRGGLFHPKIWFIRYADESGVPSYRLLVLTRNLTLDNSWDLAVRLDSERVETEEQPGSAALGDLIASLPGRALRSVSADRRQRLTSLAHEARRVVWELPSGVENLVLHHLDRGRPPTTSFLGSRHLIVSPFLDPDGIATIRSSGKVQVLSRAQELDKLDSATLQRVDARTLDDLAVLQQVQGSRLAGQLHAKMYVVEQTTQWSKSHVFIGSANATRAAFSANTEFLVELRGHKNVLGIDQFLGEKGDFTEVTEPYLGTGDAEVDPADEAQRLLDNALRRIAAIDHSIDIIPTDTAGTYAANVSAVKPYELEPGWHATVGFLTQRDEAIAAPTHGTLDVQIGPLTTAAITPFLAITIETPDGLRASSVIIADLRNAPADRLDVILATQIDSPEKFLRFLFFLLSLGDPAALANLAFSTSDDETPASPFGAGGSGVLELVLRALATRPSALVDLDALVTRLERTEQGLNSLPEGFREFWHVVREAATINETDRR